jgi:hypothetical protein
MTAGCRAGDRAVAEMLDMPYIRVLEVATFYTMFQLQPVGKKAHSGVRHHAVHAARLGRADEDLPRKIAENRLSCPRRQLSPGKRSSAWAPA